MTTVIITSIGSTGALGVLRALRTQQTYPVSVVGLDVRANVAGRYLVDRFTTVPAPSDPTYIKTLLEIAKRENAALVIPIMDEELLAISTKWPGNEKCKVACPPQAPLEISHNKLISWTWLKERGFRVPALQDRHTMRYPAIVKPVTGTGSRGVLQVKSEQEMDYASLRAQGPVIIQDYICGPEYSIDAFCTLKGTFIGAVPRLRTEIKNGLATKTTTVDEPFLVAETKRLAELLDLRGPANIQAIRNDQGHFFFTDINMRFGGACTASVRAGLNGPLFLLNELAGDAIDYRGYIAGLSMLRYWEEIFVDETGHCI